MALCRDAHGTTPASCFPLAFPPSMVVMGESGGDSSEKNQSSIKK